MKSPHYPKHAQRSGIVLLSVLWSVLILLLVLASQSRRLQLQREHASGLETEMRLRSLADSALSAICAAMDEDRKDKESLFDAPSKAWGAASTRSFLARTLPDELAKCELTLTIDDEDSKLRLLNGDPEGLSKLFQSLGLGALESDDVAARMRAITLETQAALAAGAGKGATPPFCHLRYLLASPAISSEMLYGEDADFDGSLDANEDDGPATSPVDDSDGSLRLGLDSYLTVWGDGKPNPNFAPYEVLLSVPGVSKAIAQEICAKRRGLDREQGTQDDFVFTAIEDLAKLSSVSRYGEFEYKKMAAAMRVSSRNYLAKICAAVKEPRRAIRVQALIRKSEEGAIILSRWEDNGI